MIKATKTLKSLRKNLPKLETRPQVDEILKAHSDLRRYQTPHLDGEEYWLGFKGDVSQCSHYVTDGQILLIREAIDPEFEIRKDQDGFGRKYATRKTIEKIIKSAKERNGCFADFIGCGKYGTQNIAFLRDIQGRVMVVNAHLLAFVIAAVHPDAMTVDSASFEKQWEGCVKREYFYGPLALYRKGKLVGLLMSMRLELGDLPAYDFGGDAVAIA